MASGDKSNRITIRYTPERCIHKRSGWVSCSACIDSCPGGAIRKGQGKAPELDSSRCMQCGQCLSACALEAFTSPNFTERTLLDRISGAEPIALRCFLPYGELETLAEHKNRYQLGACIAALSPGALFELALSRPCTLLMDRCATCPIFARAKPTMTANITAAFRMLHGIGRAGNLQETSGLLLPRIPAPDNLDAEATHRDTVRAVARTLFAERAKEAAPRRALQLRKKEQHVPEWRRRLKELWARHGYTSAGACDFLWPELTVDPDKCLSCGLCMQMCPTGTIVHSFTDDAFAYTFIPGTCVNCFLCIKSCPNAALSRSYRAFEQPFDEQVRYEKPAKVCASCGRPVLDNLEGEYCFRCVHERSRVPMQERLRRQLGVQSPAISTQEGTEHA